MRGLLASGASTGDVADILIAETSLADLDAKAMRAIAGGDLR
jgi:hypothetical protein